MINREEQVVIDSLRIQGYENLEHEPDGNIPPDILINSNIAIEVRRLNQKDKGGNGIEQDRYKLHTIINHVLLSESDPNNSKSIFIGYSFKRPLPQKNIIISKLKSIINDYKTTGTLAQKHKIEGSITIELFESQTTLAHQFEIARVTDLDSGGFVLPLLINNIKLSLLEKEKKVEKAKDKYSIWWLALVDSIGYVLQKDEIAFIKKILKFKALLKDY